MKAADLIFATSIVEHDFHQAFSPNLSLPDFPVRSPYEQKIQTFATNDFQIHFGKLASGDEDIVDTQRSLDLANKTHALGVTWESAGGIRVARFNKIPYTEIRAITDHADEEVKASFFQNLQKSMKNLALALDFILNSIGSTK